MQFTDSYSCIGDQLIALEPKWQQVKDVLFLILDNFMYVPVLHLMRTSYQNPPDGLLCTTVLYQMGPVP